VIEIKKIPLIISCVNNKYKFCTCRVFITS